MASLAMGVVGGVVGFWVGGPAGAAYGFSVGSAIGSYVSRPDLPDQVGPRIDDLQIQSSSYGADIPDLWGDGNRISSQLIWSTGLVETKHTESAEGGKGGQSYDVISFTYSESFALLLCEGPIVGIRRVWADGKLIMSAADSANASSVLQSTDITLGMRIHLGTDTQMPSDLMEAHLGVGNVPAYRGSAYVEFDNLQLADYGNRKPNLTFEVIKSGEEAFHVDYCNSGLVDYSVYHNNDGVLSWYNKAAAINSAVKYSFPEGQRFAMFGQKHLTDINGNDLDYTKVTHKIIANCPDYSVNLRDYGLITNSQNYAVLGIYACDNQGYGYNLMFGTGDGETFEYRADVYLSDPDGVVIGNYDIHRATYHDSRVYIHMNANFSPKPVGIDDKILVWYMPETTTGQNSITSTIFYAQPDRAIAESDITCDAFYVHPSDGIYCLTISSPNTILTLLDYDTLTTISTWTIQNYTSVDGLLVSGNYVIVGNFDAGNQNAVWKVYQFNDTSILSEAWPTTTETSGNSTESEDGSYSVGNMLYCHGSWLSPLLLRTGQTLSDIVSDICQKAGLSAADIDTTDLTDNVPGYKRPRVMSARTALEPLQIAYRFDIVESDFKLKFIKRGKPISFVIDETELGASTGDPVSTYPIKRQQESELPEIVSLEYIDLDADYQSGLQRSIRQSVNSNKHEKLSIPVAMTGDEARQAVEVLHYDAWIQRTRQALSVSRKFLQVDPGDIIQVNRENSSHVLRVQSVRVDDVLRLDTVETEQSIYTSNAVGAVSGIVEGDLGLAGPTAFYILDTNTLGSGSLYEPAFHVAIHGYLSDWPGGAIYQSVDYGVTWQRIAATNIPSIVGYATNALPNSRHESWDTENTLNVKVYGELQSLPLENVLLGSNFAAYGQPGRWELISFADATLEPDGSYTLSRLLRGRRGTEDFISLHELNDRFIILDYQSTQIVTFSPAAIGSTDQYLGVTAGKPLESGVIKAAETNATNLKPWAPVQFNGVRDGSNNITIRWKRRSRITPKMLWDPPIGEESESYEIDVVGTTRTIVSTQELAGYGAAQQSLDGITPGDPVTFRIYQISATVGRGYVLEATVQ